MHGWPNNNLNKQPAMQTKAAFTAFENSSRRWSVPTNRQTNPDPYECFSQRRFEYFQVLVAAHCLSAQR